MPIVYSCLNELSSAPELPHFRWSCQQVIRKYTFDVVESERSISQTQCEPFDMHDSPRIIGPAVTRQMNLVVGVLILMFSITAEAGWNAEIYSGTAHNFSTTLRIEQSGLPNLQLDADYSTKAFARPLYYAWRVGHWNANKAWEVEWIHHKIFLKRNAPEIQSFAISHGYNFLLVNHARKIGFVILRAGGGLVLAHPETEIRGVAFDAGYNLTGPSAQVSAGSRFYLNKRLFLAVEGKLTAARAKVLVSDGHARVPNLAIHGLFGFGIVLSE